MIMVYVEYKGEYEGTWNLCRVCRKWMEHRLIGIGYNLVDGNVYLYACVNCGTIAKSLKRR